MLKILHHYNSYSQVRINGWGSDSFSEKRNLLSSQDLVATFNSIINSFDHKGPMTWIWALEFLLWAPSVLLTVLTMVKHIRSSQNGPSVLELPEGPQQQRKKTKKKTRSLLSGLHEWETFTGSWGGVGKMCDLLVSVQRKEHGGTFAELWRWALVWLSQHTATLKTLEDCPVWIMVINEANSHCGLPDCSADIINMCLYWINDSTFQWGSVERVSLRPRF